jgi:MFS family permease
MTALAGSWAGVALVIIHAALNYLLMIALDLYLEHLSEDAVTGGIRGIFLTLANLAYLASPLVASLALERYGFGAVFALSTLALAPLAWIFVDKLPTLPHRQYERLPIWHTAHYLWQGETEHARDVRGTVLLGFILNFFYAIMVIYEPIYLHDNLGMSWPGIGIVFTVMLLPFVLLDLLLGKVADKYWGEKELMIAGLVVMGLVALAMPYISTASVLVWALVLFLSRVGAAALEMMIESYLFKKIDSQNINSLFLSRAMNPLAYIVAALLASLVLTIAPFPFLFTLLGVVMLLALPIAWQLKDTR